MDSMWIKLLSEQYLMNVIFGVVFSETWKYPSLGTVGYFPEFSVPWSQNVIHDGSLALARTIPARPGRGHRSIDSVTRAGLDPARSTAQYSTVRSHSLPASLAWLGHGPGVPGESFCGAVSIGRVRSLSHSDI